MRTVIAPGTPKDVNGPVGTRVAAWGHTRTRTARRAEAQRAVSRVVGNYLAATTFTGNVAVTSGCSLT